MLSFERVEKTLRFEKPDRMPVIEWAPYWDQTVERWRAEGLEADIQNRHAVRKSLGLDPLVDIWVTSKNADCPEIGYGQPYLNSIEEYRQFRNLMYSDSNVSDEEIARAAREQRETGAAAYVWIWGFFWAPRAVLGIEGQLYAFYDNPELMDWINRDQLEFIRRTIKRIAQKVKLQFIVLGEDMSYKSGPMISRALFDARMMPFYRELLPELKACGVKVFVDSDGLVDVPMDWYAEAGFDGMLPMERQAGVDLNTYRRKHPGMRFVGGFDKRAMSRGEQAMRAEFDRLLPVMRQGGYILGVDHQTPPEVSLEDYRLYLRLLREYAARAAQQ